MRVFVAGASGVIGSALLPRLADRSDAVFGLAKTDRGRARVSAWGIPAIACDILDHPRVMSILGEFSPDVVVNLITALPKTLRPKSIAQDTAQTNHLRVVGTMVLLDAARKHQVRRMVIQSSAAIYAPADPSSAVESDPFYTDAPGGFDAVVKAISEMEMACFNQAGVQAIALRLGHIYGTGTAYDTGGYLRRETIERRMPLSGKGGGRFSFVHLSDVVSAILAAIESTQTGAFNIVDDHPVTYSEWLPWFARELKAPKPFRVPLSVVRIVAGDYGVHLIEHQRGASNAKARLRLGWQPDYPDWRAGFRQWINIE